MGKGHARGKRQGREDVGEVGETYRKWLSRTTIGPYAVLDRLAGGRVLKVPVGGAAFPFAEGAVGGGVEGNGEG